MKRKLIRQMLNLWRSNIWMLVQLLIVSCVIFYMCTGLYYNVHNYYSPFGYDTENTYQITLAKIPETGEGYIPDRSQEQFVEDVLTIIQRLKSMDQVENVAYSRWSGPYLANFMGSRYTGILGNDTIVVGGNEKKVSPEYIELFRIKSTDGTTPEQLVKLLEQGKILASKEVAKAEQNYVDLLNNPVRLKDYVFQNGYDSIDHHIGAIVESTKRFDFDNITPVIYQLYKPQDIQSLPEISVRIKANADGDKFIQSIRDQTPTYFSCGNIYVQNIQPYHNIKEKINTQYNREIIYSVVCICFLLINIFLGLFGVFWFRTRQRTSEIALRKSLGATSGSIYRRLVSEGLPLLLATLPFAVIIDWILATHELTGDRLLNYFGLEIYWDRWLISVIATTVVMAIMIIIGISLPAYRAMRIQPAEALKDE